MQTTAKVESGNMETNSKPYSDHSKKFETWHLHGSALFEKLNANSLLKKLYENDKNSGAVEVWTLISFPCQFFNNVQILTSDRGMVLIGFHVST